MERYVMIDTCLSSIVKADIVYTGSIRSANTSCDPVKMSESSSKKSLHLVIEEINRPGSDNSEPESSAATSKIYQGVTKTLAMAIPRGHHDQTLLSVLQLR
jgi:hypothetical protein